ncbi:GGDEF domain-containing protein [Brevibacillus dissolubilis]|uniref:GGDEF domain-containing protein n=1 Tax=Brevibacillus dissolubilis TaxID=1844116 RepID=UPI001115C73C|nr:GGDEF domain-containing protein [Brevibacillus dissolubilis]
MLGLRVYIFTLFFLSMAVALPTYSSFHPSPAYYKAYGLYLIFSFLYHHLRFTSKKGNSTVDYGINYGLSFAYFAGPFGIFLFEAVYRVMVWFNKKWTKTADPDEGLHTFYNIGSATLSGSIGYYLYHTLSPLLLSFPSGNWILVFGLAVIAGLLSDLMLITALYFLGEIKTRKEAIDFRKNRTIFDTAKTAFSNGLLIYFLQQENWNMLIGIFILNYLVSQSYLAKAQSIQDKIERDKYEQMAYTDYLTGVHNRAYMDKQMAELNRLGESVGIVVTDIDKFKRINDTYNHTVGDRVIQNFAAILKSHLREDDLLVRSGGEEFTFFLRNRDAEQCAVLVEQIRRAVATSQVIVEYGEGTTAIAYTASFGLYYRTADEPISMEKGYVCADQLLLQAKQMGRNRLSVVN